jgi:hypothetical protein
LFHARIRGSQRRTFPQYFFILRAEHRSHHRGLFIPWTVHPFQIVCPHCGSKNAEQEAAAFFAVTGKKS